MAVSRQTVNLLPLGKHWGFDSLPAHHAEVTELAYVLALEARFCGFDSPIDRHQGVVQFG